VVLATPWVVPETADASSIRFYVPEELRETRRQHAREDVVVAARGERHDEREVARRPVLREPRCRRAQGEERNQKSERCVLHGPHFPGTAHQRLGTTEQIQELLQRFQVLDQMLPPPASTKAVLMADAPL
jgi:hypothetical protein